MKGRNAHMLKNALSLSEQSRSALQHLYINPSGLITISRYSPRHPIGLSGPIWWTISPFSAYQTLCKALYLQNLIALPRQFCLMGALPLVFQGRLSAQPFLSLKHSSYLWPFSCFSRVRLFATLGTVGRQAALSMGFSRQEYWTGLPCAPAGDLYDPGIEAMSPALAGGFTSHRATKEAHTSY